MDNRELDAKMGELMGWRLLAGDTWVDEKKRVAHPFFRPSTDIAAAMQVVEKMAEKGWYLDLIGKNGYDINFIHHRDRVDASDILLPLAICRAALKAVEANK